MFGEYTLLISAAILLMAMLYSTVGHGGASGYLAVLAIAGLAPAEMRTTALLLNIIVASISTYSFCKNTSFRKDLFFPLITSSMPAAFVGGLIEVPPAIFKPIIGVVLLYASIRLCIPVRGNEQTKRPSIAFVVFTGATIGVMSGIIGVGGGIFLSPFVLLLGWGTAKQTAVISAPFILLNSVAGLGGIAFDHHGLPADALFVVPLLVSVVIGGLIGASFGSKRLGHQGLRLVLGVVLLIASAKMFITAFDVQHTAPAVDVKSTL